MAYSTTLKDLRRLARARELLAFAGRSHAHRQMAYWLAGWGDWLALLPAPPARRAPTRLRHVVAGGAALILALCLVIGPFLRLVHPLLVALGALPDWKQLLVAVFVLNALQWFLGRGVLRRLRMVVEGAL